MAAAYRGDFSPGTGEDADRLAEAVMGAAAEVRRTLGPRQREPVYAEALCVELDLRGVPFVRRNEEPVEYKGRRLASGRTDIIVGDALVVEFVEFVEGDEGDESGSPPAGWPPGPVRISEVLSRLRATGLRPRLRLGFKAPAVRYGLRRF